MIIVYYIERIPGWEDVVFHEEFKSYELAEALAACERLRKVGFVHVCISSELDDSVGKPGVDTIKDGKTPDGHEYGWKKRRD